MGEVYKIDGPTVKVCDWVNGGLAGKDFHIEGKADHVITDTGNWYDVINCNMAAATSFKRMLNYTDDGPLAGVEVLSRMQWNYTHDEFYYGHVGCYGYIMHENELELGDWREEEIDS